MEEEEEEVEKEEEVEEKEEVEEDSEMYSECLKCIPGSGNLANHRGTLPKMMREKKATAAAGRKSQKSDRKKAASSKSKSKASRKKGGAEAEEEEEGDSEVEEDSEMYSECRKCIPGSGNLANHRGRHRTANVGKRDSEVEEDSEMYSECRKCIPGSGNLANHRGRHRTANVGKRDSEVEEDMTEEENTEVEDDSEMYSECRKCIPGSGNLANHRGRHRTAKVEKGVGSNMNAPKKKRGRPLGSKNKRGRPLGSKKKRGRPLGSKKKRGRPLGSKKKCGRPLGSKKKRGRPLGSKKKCGRPLGSKKKRGSIETNKAYVDAVVKSKTFPERTAAQKKSWPPLNWSCRISWRRDGSRGDVYYYTQPDCAGKPLRSGIEVQEWIAEHPGDEVKFDVNAFNAHHAILWVGKLSTVSAAGKKRKRVSSSKGTLKKDKAMNFSPGTAFICEFGCDYVGLFDEVSEHEKTCQRRLTRLERTRCLERRGGSSRSKEAPRQCGKRRCRRLERGGEKVVFDLGQMGTKKREY